MKDEIDQLSHKGLPEDIIYFLKDMEKRLDFVALKKTKGVQESSREMLCLFFYSVGYLSGRSELND